MRYGHMINGQLIVVKNRDENDKPIIYSNPPEAGYHETAVFNYEDTGEQIEQVWAIIPTQDEPPEDVDDVEAFKILLGGAT